jgi:uncharacterized membrane protein YcjF (UPF0283 family)
MPTIRNSDRGRNIQLATASAIAPIFRDRMDQDSDAAETAANVARHKRIKRLLLIVGVIVCAAVVVWPVLLMR